MKYEELEKNLKSSLNKSIGNIFDEIINDFLKASTWVEKIVDEKLALRITEELKKPMYRYTKWSQAGYKPEFEEIYEILLKKESNFRKKKKTEKQIEFFKEVFGQDAEIPTDYLDFQIKLDYEKENYFKELGKKQKATEKQISTIEKLWDKHNLPEFEMWELTKDQAGIFFYYLNGKIDLDQFTNKLINSDAPREKLIEMDLIENRKPADIIQFPGNRK